MWCEKVIRNVSPHSTGADDGRAIDVVEIEWYQCRRSLAAISRAGERIRVWLAAGQILQHGDVIYEDERKRIIIDVLPCEIVVVRMANWRALALLALELGNLHLPVQIGDWELAFIENEAAIRVLEMLGVAWSQTVRRFEPQPITSLPKVQMGSQFQIVMRSGQGEPDQVHCDANSRSVASKA